MQEMQKGGFCPGDHTLQGGVSQVDLAAALAATAAESAPKASKFKFAVPSDALLKFSGPRGDEYVKACMDGMAAAAERYDSCMHGCLHIR